MVYAVFFFKIMSFIEPFNVSLKSVGKWGDTINITCNLIDNLLPYTIQWYKIDGYGPWVKLSHTSDTIVIPRNTYINYAFYKCIVTSQSVKKTSEKLPVFLEG